MAAGMVMKPFVNRMANLSVSRILTQVDTDTGIACISLNKPPMNTLCLEMTSEVADAIERLERDRSVRGITLQSSSQHHVFTSGFCLHEFYQKPRSSIEEVWKSTQRLLLNCFSCTKPLVVAINGDVSGAGNAFILASDCRIMRDDGKIELFQSQLPYFEHQLMPILRYLIGGSKAETILFRNKVLSSHQAAAEGLVDIVDAKGEVRATANAEVKRLTEITPTLYASFKLQARSSVLREISRNTESISSEFANAMLDPVVQDQLAIAIEDIKL